MQRHRRPGQRTSSLARAVQLLGLSLLVMGLSLGLGRAQHPETGPGGRLVPVNVMERGGLFVPSTEPGFVIPALSVGALIDIDVHGPVARTTLRQTFVNPTDRWVEGVYVYPLPDGATVDRLRMIFEDRIVEGRIDAREAAETAYREALEAGQQASLVTQERPNLFTNAVANIAPGSTLTIEIQFQEVLHFADGSFELRFPMAITPRYLPGDEIRFGAGGTGSGPDTDRVPDGSRITPPVAHPDFGPINEVRMSVTLDPGFPVAALRSPTHAIEVTEEPGDRYRVDVPEEAVFADRDFVLTWGPKPSSDPYAAILSERVGAYDYHLVMLTPPMEAGLSAEPPPREVVFIIDTSGSMSGDPIHQARQALEWALDRLRPVDRFNVVEFNSFTRTLFPEAVPASPTNLQNARLFVRALVADGGTEMRPALEAALDGRHTPGRIRQVVFITDGAVGNEAELFGVIGRRLGNSRLFTVGIGSAPNSHFMREAAAAGRGTYTFIGSLREVGERMAGLFRRLEHPAMTDIALDWPARPVEAYPELVPDLYVGEPIVVAVRQPAGASGPLTIEGRIGGQPWSRTLALGAALPAEEGGAAGIARLWGRDKIAELERQLAQGAPGARIDREILDVALELQIVSRLTSLVAIDSQVVRPEEETVETEAVAGNLPHGSTMGMDPSPLRADAAAQPMSPAAAIRNMAQTGSPFAATLPGTAIGTWLQVAAGAVLVLLALLLLAWARRLDRSAR